MRGAWQLFAVAFSSLGRSSAARAALDLTDAIVLKACAARASLGLPGDEDPDAVSFKP
ncbi:hypothetical protein D3C80_1978100 [compost metagenome]